jgi:NitT/TauT family transport system substrate-binding protein
MSDESLRGWKRRQFLGGMGAVGAVGLLGGWMDAAAEPPPETTTLRLPQFPDPCAGLPIIVAGELLKAEGFIEVQYVKRDASFDGIAALAAGEVDLTVIAVPILLSRIDAGDPFTILAGIHVGCFELFGSERIRSMRDFKGKKVAVTRLGSGRHAFAASMAAHVGLDPRRDIEWVTTPVAESIRAFADGTIDGFMGFPPEPQELRAKKIGRVIVNTTLDRPWSQYFCCMVVAHRDFVRRHPVATKRALRAILKASSLCAVEPARAVKLRADRGYADPNGYVQQMIQELSYGRWREYEPADTVRFYALRFNEVGLIKSSPQKILADGTDFRLVTELKRELKG